MDHLAPLLEAIDHADHVVGCRPMSRGDPSRLVGSLFRRMIFGVPLRDVHSPCRLHRLDKLLAIPLQSRIVVPRHRDPRQGDLSRPSDRRSARPRLRGRSSSAGWWRIVIASCEILGSLRPSGPAEEPQCQHEGDHSPGGEDRAPTWRHRTGPPPRAAPGAGRLTSCVSGRAWIKGWAAAGNRSDEKKTPEKSHIGSMTRFMSPLTVSVVLARQATRRPIPANASAPKMSIPITSARLPRIGIWNMSVPKRRRTARSGSTKVSRAPNSASKKSRRGMGVATNRLRSLAIRKLTSRKPMPQSPPPIAFKPIKPGIRKSM